MNSEQKKTVVLATAQSLSAMESKYEKLVIIATVAPTALFPKELSAKVHERWTMTTEELADEIYRCYQAGASIAHIHGEKPWSKEKWTELIGLVREKCDILIQMGLSTATVEERRPTMVSKPEMLSIMITHHSESFTEIEYDELHTMKEIEGQVKLCDEFSVKPELEIWGTGGIWTLRNLLDRKVLKSPPLVTLFFGWPGGNWTPPTLEEVMARVSNLPPGSVWSTSSMEDPVPNCLNISVLSIMLGGHVRIGSEDYPFIRPGVLAKDVPELVARIARISRELNREVATPSEARKMIGI